LEVDIENVSFLYTSGFKPTLKCENRVFGKKQKSGGEIELKE